jgi:transcriptional regulator with XRE-family HTH domain
MSVTEKQFKEIGKRLKKFREDKRISQTELAESMDILPNQYGKVENGKVLPSLKTLVKAAEALEISIDEIVYGVQSPVALSIKDAELVKKMNIISELPAEDKFIALEMLDLLIAKNAIKGLAKDFTSRTHPRFKK